MNAFSNSKKSPQSGKLEGVWRTYDNTDGLLAGVNCLLQDHQGLLWLATNGGGVSCFDGVQFTNYTTEDGLYHNDVRAIYQDSASRL